MKGALAMFVALVSLGLGAASARAEAPTPAKDPRLAQSLFEEGRTLLEKGEVDRACPIFAESLRLDPGGGTMLNLALCHEKQGKLATAWAEYNAGLSLALSDARTERVDLARERIDALRPRLPRLIVRAASEAMGMEITVDGGPLAAAALGVPAYVDPGAHELRASATARVPWSLRVVLSEGQSEEVLVPVLAPTPAGERRAGATASRLGTGSYVAGAVALGALGFSVVSGAMALGAQSDAKAKCGTRDFCADKSGESDAARARTLAWVSTAALGVGVAAAVTAALWPRTQVAEKHTTFVVLPSLGPKNGGLVFHGAF